MAAWVDAALVTDGVSRNGGLRAARPRFDRALATILVAAALVRLIGIRFGLPHPDCRPDETAIGSVATLFYFGHFNPHFFNYPALFMEVVAACVFAWVRLGWVLGYVNDRAAMNALVTTTSVHSIARLLSAAAGVATVWAVYKIALRLFDRTTALGAASYLALAFLHVRDSHFGVTDVPATFAAAAAFLATLRLRESRRTGDLIAAAVLAGLATSTKYNVALIAVPGLLVVAQDSARSVGMRAARASGFILVMATAFVAASPYSLLAWPEFIAAVQSESAHLQAGHGVALGRGWIVHLTSSLRYGVGWPMLATSIAGFAALIARRPATAVLLGSFPLLYYAGIGSGYTVFARYALPLVPFVCIGAAVATTETARLVSSRWPGHLAEPALAAALAAVVVIPSARSVAAFDRLLARTDNRLIAARWLEQRFPAGATLAQFGGAAGRVVVAAGDPARAPLFRDVRYDGSGPAPDAIVIQRSAIGGDSIADVPPGVLDRQYVLGAFFEAAPDDPRNVYDWQDEFYLPLSGFVGIVRPGPDFRIYVRGGR